MVKYSFLVLLFLLAAFILSPSQASAFSNVTRDGYPIRWWPGDSPVTFYVNNKNEIAGDSTYEYVRAARLWWNNAGANIQIQDAGPACFLGCSTYSQNGKNELIFSSSSGVTDTSTIIQPYYDCGQQMTFGGRTYCRITEVDIEFRAISTDLAAYALGQALGLGDSGVAGSVMRRRSLWYPGVGGLSSDDLDGIRSIYGLYASISFLAGVSSTPSCTVTGSPNPDNALSGTWPDITISSSLSGMTGGNIHYYNPGRCSLAGCPVDGWSIIAPYQASYIWNPNSFVYAAGTHTIGVTDANNVLQCVYDQSFTAPGVLAQLEQCNAAGTGWDPIGSQCTNLCTATPPTPTPTPPGSTPTSTPTPGAATPTPTPGAATPTPSSGPCPWIKTTGGDVHSNEGINTGC